MGRLARSKSRREEKEKEPRQNPNIALKKVTRDGINTDARVGKAGNREENGGGERGGWINVREERWRDKMAGTEAQSRGLTKIWTENVREEIWG
jgi:hypothetical protein